MEVVKSSLRHLNNVPMLDDMNVSTVAYRKRFHAVLIFNQKKMRGAPNTEKADCARVKIFRTMLSSGIWEI